MKDRRLYANITHDFADSPKVMILSVEAKWSLLEMILWSCRMQTDGVISRRVAAAKWSLDVCQELATNDPEVPSLLELENGDFQIHDFAEHQTTKAEIEAIREQKRRAGALGGRAKSARRHAKTSKRVAGAKAGAKQTSSTTPSRNVAAPLAEPGISKKKEERGGDVAFSDTVRGNSDANEPPSLDDLAAAHSAGAASPTPPVTPGPGGLFGTPDDPRCAEHAHLRREDVPPCRMCAAAREQHQARAADEANRRRVEIEACGWCDDRGMVEIHTPDGSALAARCDHTSPPEPPPTATQGEFQPTSDPGVRKRLLNRSKGPTPPF